ncbi:hypothetical protein GCM10009839_38840 [Catenulispora yoronensis]|uniref:HEPN AbiU2-like domain-containing protein n=1 Tax=Catenulispora yoronensis TaxID=450799 RepID=A0ABN2UDI4_9ACTN
MNLDERWQRWTERFAQAERDIRDLFHNRHVWVALTRMWDETAAEIELNTIVRNWHIRLYVTTQVTGIRRECDPGTTTSSLLNCLQELTKFPSMMDRARFEANVDANPEIANEFKAVNKRKFDQFATSTTSGELDVTKIDADIERLKGAAEAARRYMNKIVGHREFPPKPITLSWADLDGALNMVGIVQKRYYSLWNAAVIKGNLTPELPAGWEHPYRFAWRPTHFEVPRARPLDEYVTPQEGI